MVAPGDLFDRVAQKGYDDLEPVLHPAARPGQVHDQGSPGHAGHPARERRGGNALGHAVGADGLGDAGDLELEQRAGHLGRPVRRADPGPTGRQHDLGSGTHRVADRLAHRVAVGDDRSIGDVEARIAQGLDDQRSRLVGVHTTGRSVGRDDHGLLHGRSAGAVQSPLLPPLLESSRTSVIVAALSTALTMSTTVRAATDTAVNASISTPVRSVVRTVAVISTASSATARFTSTPLIASGWHSGTRSGVRFAAMMPASRATPRASPLGTPEPRNSTTTSAETSTRPAATATRCVTSLSETSTIRAAPDSSTCVNRGSVIRSPGPARSPRRGCRPAAPRPPPVRRRVRPPARGRP